ncbi:flagellar basal body protein [Rubrivivax sp. RP6-9]|uniref:flagellar basal body protein n=1 Tax=Rubrivivax sp. RP6-9 TaxID=3415750 RepID=UPI003CC5B425
MTSVSGIALSGMQSAQAALGVAGHNIANAATSGFQRQQAVAATVPDSGVATSVRTLPPSGEGLDSLATDLVGQLQAKNAFLANLAVFRTGDAMAGALLRAVA